MTIDRVILGKITGLHGVKGWLKVYSHSRPPENIFQYPTWCLLDGSGAISNRAVEEYRHQGKRLLVKFAGIDNRDSAQSLVGLEVAVDAEQLPALDDEYYWRDLIGLTVMDLNGKELGKVVDMMETGSNDVLLLHDGDGKRLAIPWLPEVVIEVNLAQSRLIADWEDQL